MIIFKTVRWRNFLSTGNNFTEIQLDRNSTTLIIGENGAGKSTILDALCFGLFGKPFRGINKAQLINSVNMSGAMVEVEFEIGTKKIKVVRGIKPNVFEIYVNGKMYNQDANSRDYQKYLEQQILKLNYRSFTQVVILGSSTFIPFMQLKARHRREVVEEILDIQIFSLMNMLLKQKLKNNAEEIRDVEYKTSLTEEKVDLQINYIDEIKKNKNKLLKDKSILFASNQEEVYKRQKKVIKYENTNIALLKQIVDSDTIKSKYQKLQSIKSTLNEKHRAHSSTINFFETNEDCPTCQQHISEIFKTNIIKKKTKETDKISDGLLELKAELEKYKDRQKEIVEIANGIREHEVQIAKDNESILQLEKFNSTLQSEIDVLEHADVNRNDYEKLGDLKSSLLNLTYQKSKLLEDKTYSETAKNMLQDTGIKTKIIKQYLPIMNKLINTYLSSMEFYVNFTLDESFDLALLFTWRAVAKMKNSANTNLLILDEIFDSSLDGTGTDEFLKILNTLGGENVFVISHKQDALADKFRSTIKFHKAKNFSHMVE
jgi:DNA repair exonuclease SbcCD ATPase subunit